MLLNRLLATCNEFDGHRQMQNRAKKIIGSFCWTLLFQNRAKRIRAKRELSELNYFNGN